MAESQRTGRAMYESAQKEQFSQAYVHAVAAVAGFTIGSFTVDVDSVDLELRATERFGEVDGLPFNLQLKCTKNLTGTADHWSFPLKRKNYDDLRNVRQHLDTLLVVVHVPADHGDWLTSSSCEMTLRRCAYWASLRGRPAVPPGQRSVTVHVPRCNVFDVEGLRDIAEKLARDEAL